MVDQYSINTLATIAPIILREGLLAFRENSIAARLVGFDVSAEAAQKGSTIDVEIPSVIPVQEVNVSTANSPTALTPSVVAITLDNWYEAKFSMSDKDITVVKPGYLPMQASQAIKALCNKVDTTIINLYKDVFGYYFSTGNPNSLAHLASIRKVLNDQLCPIEDRYLLVDTAAEAGMLGVDAFVGADKVGDTVALRNGSLGRFMGFDIHMDQNMPIHTKGTIASTGTKQVKGTATAGAKTVTLEGSDGNLTGTVVIGDKITIAGSGQHVITANATAAANECVIAFEPGLRANTLDHAAFGIYDTHRVNLAFNKNAFCFVSRPLKADQGLGSIIESITDPISGISLRLEITRSNKSTTWSYDILWGVKTIYRELAAVLGGANS